MPGQTLLATLRSLVLPLALIVFTAAYLNDALKLGSPLRYGVPSAAFMPLVLSAVMFVALLAVIVDTVRTRAAASAQDPLGALVRPGLVVVATALYIAFFQTSGFAIGTFLYVYVMVSLFGYRDGRTLAGQALRLLLALIITGSVYMFFVGAFDVQLPSIEGLI